MPSKNKRKGKEKVAILSELECLKHQKMPQCGLALDDLSLEETKYLILELQG